MEEDIIEVDIGVEIMSPRHKVNLKKMRKVVIVVIGVIIEEVEALTMDEEEDMVVEVGVHTSPP
jgi:hypothetical protein